MKRISVAALALCWLSPGPAAAYRPFDGTDADVAGYRALELEIGPVGALRHDRSRFIVAPALVINYGLFRGWEAVLAGRHEIGLGAADPRFRVVDTEFSLKGLLRPGQLQGASGLSVATEFGTFLPGVSDGSAFGAHAALITSTQSRFLTLHLNTAVDLDRAHRLAGVAGLIAEGPESWVTRPVAEILVARVFTDDLSQRWTVSGLVGTITPVSERVSLDFAFRGAREQSAYVEEVRAGFTVTVGG